MKIAFSRVCSEQNLNVLESVPPELGDPVRAMLRVTFSFDGWHSFKVGIGDGRHEENCALVFK